MKVELDLSNEEISAFRMMAADLSIKAENDPKLDDPTRYRDIGDKLALAQTLGEEPGRTLGSTGVVDEAFNRASDRIAQNIEVLKQTNGELSASGDQGITLDQLKYELDLSEEQYTLLTDALEKARQSEISEISDITDPKSFGKASSLSKIQDSLAIQHNEPERASGVLGQLQSAFERAFDEKDRSDLGDAISVDDLLSSPHEPMDMEFMDATIARDMEHGEDALLKSAYQLCDEHGRQVGETKTLDLDDRTNITAKTTDVWLTKDDKLLASAEVTPSEGSIQIDNKTIWINHTEVYQLSKQVDSVSMGLKIEEINRDVTLNQDRLKALTDSYEMAHEHGIQRGPSKVMELNDGITVTATDDHLWVKQGDRIMADAKFSTEEYQNTIHKDGKTETVTESFFGPTSQNVRMNPNDIAKLSEQLGVAKDDLERNDPLLTKPSAPDNFKEPPIPTVKTEKPFTAAPDIQVNIGELTKGRHQANQDFYSSVSEAVEKYGESHHGNKQMKLPDGLTAVAGNGQIAITRPDGKGNRDVVYSQSKTTSHLSGSGAGYIDKLPSAQKQSLQGHINQIKSPQKTTTTKRPAHETYGNRSAPQRQPRQRTARRKSGAQQIDFGL